MAIISRPPKQGGSTTYQGKVAQGFKRILAAEADADHNTIYDAWNTGVDAVNIQPNAVTAEKIAPNVVGPRELVDDLPGSVLAVDAITPREIAPNAVGSDEIAAGSVTKAKLAPDADLWTDTGSALRPTQSTRGVALAGTAPHLTVGSATVKGTLEASATGLTILASNRAAAPTDAAKPSWAVQLDPIFDAFQVARRAAGAPANSQSFPLTVRNDGKTVCNLADGSVTAPMLAPGACKRQYGLFRFAPGIVISPSTWVAPGTVTLTTSGGIVLIWIVSGLVAFQNGAQGEFYVGWSRDTAQAAGPTTYDYVRYPCALNSLPPIPTFIGLDQPPAGTHDYYANFYIVGGSIVGAAATPGFIAAVEFS